MKNIFSFKTTLLGTILITLVLLGLSSCGSDQKLVDNTAVGNEPKADSTTVVPEAKETSYNETNEEKNAQFLANAAEINLEEIQLGKLAQQKGTMPEVKELGKMMETAHTKSMTDLTALAKKKSITIPTSSNEKVKGVYQTFSDKPSNDFDKAYCDMMVNGHKEAIMAFEKASTESSDADIKEWAKTTLPVLRTHLEHALTCQKKCEKSN